MSLENVINDMKEAEAKERPFYLKSEYCFLMYKKLKAIQKCLLLTLKGASKDKIREPQTWNLLMLCSKMIPFKNRNYIKHQNYKSDHYNYNYTFTVEEIRTFLNAVKGCDCCEDCEGACPYFDELGEEHAIQWQKMIKYMEEITNENS